MKPDLIKIAIFIIACMATGSGFGKSIEFALLASIAANIWLLFRASRLHNWFSNRKELPHAEQGVFYLLHRDIRTMREKHHHQKRALQKNLQEFREASAALPDAIVITEKSGEISWSNPLAKELLSIEYPRDTGHRISNLIRTPLFADAFANQENMPVNIDMPAPNHRNQMINLKVIDLAQNTLMIVARDITRHTNIHRAQKDFVSNVSHELKTPLTVIHGYLEMISDHPQAADELSKPIADMSIQTKRMQSTIDDLLYLAKLESQSRGLASSEKQHEPIIIASIIDIIMDSAQILAERQEQKITTEINDQLSIHGNSGELQIAFSNLITNAIRYTPKGGKIVVKWHHRDNNAVFSVQDDGIGIAPNHISRLTERFYRVDQGRSRERGGTGLGLSIVKNVLERHDATLKINSSLGNGSCFECIFPRDSAKLS